MARIVTVYTDWPAPFVPAEMGYIRWLKISEALARRGHTVDIATNEALWDEGVDFEQMGPNLRRVPLPHVRWDQYDVVKTLFHVGFATLERYGGTRHPFIISKLGSVVGPVEMPGIHFFGERRAHLFSVQTRIRRTSHFVTVISRPAASLWHQCFGASDNVLVVPGAADAHVPPPGANPFPSIGQVSAVFAGNVYHATSQPEAHATLIHKLNRLGGLLLERNVRLYVMGRGDVTDLDRDRVTVLGPVPYAESWSYLQHANVGVVVSAGYHHNNESTKIYHYLRVGLPVVSEAGFPNDHVIADCGCGRVVGNGDLDGMADAIADATTRAWPSEAARAYVLKHHTWDRRIDAYEALFRTRLQAAAP